MLNLISKIKFNIISIYSRLCEERKKINIEILKTKRNRVIFSLIGIAIGFTIGLLFIFHIFFLYRVIPHGGF